MGSNVAALPFDLISGHPRLRRALVSSALVALSAVSLSVAYSLRFDFRVPSADWRIVGLTLPLLLVLRWYAFLLFRVDARPIRFASPADFLPIFQAVTMSSGVYALVVKVVAPQLYFPRSVLLIEWLLSQVLVVGVYAGSVVYREAYAPARSANRRVLVAGCGDSLLPVLRQLHSSGRWNPVGVLLDDPSRLGEKLLGVTIEGTLDTMVSTARRTGADIVCFANPGIGHKRFVALIAECRQNGIEFVAVRSQAAKDGGAATDDAGIEVILKREEVAIDMGSVQSMIAGRNIVVTGAGGSIGSELTRQIAALEPKTLSLVERSENNLFFINREIKLKYPALNLRPLLVDISDSQTLTREMLAAQPDIVFHAAAYKHVGMMEARPQEAVRNNVLGTYNVALAAARAGAGRFINISTDKAVRPKSYMGLSKRLAELCIQEMNARFDTKFVTVRFGNVAGSSGSVVQLFRQQIEQGGPVTVTDPQARRFFMSIPEAVRLVLQAAVYSERGGIFVLDMGQPIEIYELAKTMISLSGHLPHVDIPIEFTRLGQGEKLTEELQDEDESLLATDHPRILSIAKTERPAASILALIPRWRQLLEHAEISELIDELYQVWPGLAEGRTRPVLSRQHRGITACEGRLVN